MCGIYGITDHDPTFIQNYINQCGHRGPDAQKVWWDPEHKVTLGHNLLSIMKIQINGETNLRIQKFRTYIEKILYSIIQ